MPPFIGKARDPRFTSRKLLLGLMAFAAANCLYAAYEPTPGLEKFGLETSKFRQTKAFSVFDGKKGYARNVHYNYAYKDGRYARYHDSRYGGDTDIGVEVYEFASPDKAQAFLQKKLAGLVPEAQASAVKLLPCRGEKRNGDNFVGPSKLVRKHRHPNGTEVVVWHSGDFNMVDCSRGNNWDEYVSWTDGAYFFEVCSQPMVGVKSAYGWAEEFALDYLAALGQPVGAPR